MKLKHLTQEQFQTLVWHWQKLGSQVVFLQKDPLKRIRDNDFLCNKLLAVECGSNSMCMSVRYYRYDSNDSDSPVNQDAFIVGLDGSFNEVKKSENPEHHLKELPKRLKDMPRIM